MGLNSYLEQTEDPLLKLVYRHENSKKLYSVAKDARKFKGELEVPDTTRIQQEPVTLFAKRVKQETKKKAHEMMRQIWEGKPMHGQYPARVNKPDVEKEKTHKWLKSPGLKGETEGLIIAAQDQSLATRSYHNKIIKDGTDPKCGMCNEFEETIDHIVAGCPVLAKTEYIQRYDKAAGYLHWRISKHYHFPAAYKWYEHKPEKVTENETATILWDMPVNTDKEIKANRPDIIIKDKKEKICIMIGMSIPSERNVSIKEVEKLSKYKDLELEVTKMWEMKTSTVPIVVGALGLVKKGLEKYASQIPGHIRIEELQKIALLGSAHILRRTLSIK